VLDGEQTITVVRPAALDRNGDPTGAAVEHTVDRCLIAPTEGAENTDHADTVITEFTVYAPPGADVLATDQVRGGGVLGDLVYEVVARPRAWLAEGLVFNLRAVTG
jgi:hypothetical protein